MAYPAFRWAVGTYIALRIVYSAWAGLVVFLNPQIVSNLDLFGTPVLAAFDLRTGERAVFSRIVDGREMHWRAAPPNWVDVETGSIWDFSGRAVSGPLAGTTLQPSSYTAEDVFPYRGVPPVQDLVLSPWQRFDTNWYLAIAEHGYGNITGDIHFPPLYPIFIRLLGTVLLGHDLLAAWLVSNVAIIVVFTLLYEKTAKWMDTEAAQKAVVYLALFPTAFFLFAPYSESLFLLFVLLFFVALGRERWVWAGLCAGLAVLTRLQGIVLLLPLVYGWLQSKSFSKSGIVAIALPPVAALIYLVLRASVAPVSVLPMNEPELSARLIPPWENYLYAITTLLSGRFILPDLLNFLAALLLVIAVVAGWRRLPMSLNLYNVGSLFLLTMRFVDTQPLNSLIRYSLAFFPVFVFLGSVGKNPWANRVILYAGFALNLYLTAQFVLWGWVA
jgi:hypothetical protein